MKEGKLRLIERSGVVSKQEVCQWTSLAAILRKADCEDCYTDCRRLMRVRDIPAWMCFARQKLPRSYDSASRRRLIIEQVAMVYTAPWIPAGTGMTS